MGPIFDFKEWLLELTTLLHIWWCHFLIYFFLSLHISCVPTAHLQAEINELISDCACDLPSLTASSKAEGFLNLSCFKCCLWVDRYQNTLRSPFVSCGAAEKDVSLQSNLFQKHHVCRRRFLLFTLSSLHPFQTQGSVLLSQEADKTKGACVRVCYLCTKPKHLCTAMLTYVISLFSYPLLASQRAV